MYPLVESTHVLTLCLFVGMSVMLDLRLLGLTLRRVAVSEVTGRLLPMLRAGLTALASSASAVSGVRVESVRAVRVRATRPVAVHVDAEPIGTTPVEIEVLHRALCLRVWCSIQQPA